MCINSLEFIISFEIKNCLFPHTDAKSVHDVNFLIYEHSELKTRAWFQNIPVMKKYLPFSYIYAAMLRKDYGTQLCQKTMNFKIWIKKKLSFFVMQFLVRQGSSRNTMLQWMGRQKSNLSSIDHRFLDSTDDQKSETLKFEKNF